VTNVGNVRIELQGNVVRLSQHVRHPTVLDCLLTVEECRKLAALLATIQPRTVENDNLL
jgi:hypothetical protein